MKRVIVAVLSLVVVCFVLLSVNFISNRVFLNNYEDGRYKLVKNGVLGFTEPYIVHYNNGNVYFNQKQYEAAISEFKKALEKNPPGERDCEVRINLALSMVKSFNPDEVNDENRQDIIDMLKEARDYLLENGCANENPEEAHNEDAQTLKEEIDEMIKMLEEQQSEPESETESEPESQTESEPESQSESETESQSEGETESESEGETESQSEGESEGETETGDNETQPGGDETEPETKDPIEQALENLQNQSNNAHQGNMQEYENLYGDNSYYYGPNW